MARREVEILSTMVMEAGAKADADARAMARTTGRIVIVMVMVDINSVIPKRYHMVGVDKDNAQYSAVFSKATKAYEVVTSLARAYNNMAGRKLW